MNESCRCEGRLYGRNKDKHRTWCPLSCKTEEERADFAYSDALISGGLAILASDPSLDLEAQFPKDSPK